MVTGRATVANWIQVATVIDTSDVFLAIIWVRKIARFCASKKYSHCSGIFC